MTDQELREIHAALLEECVWLRSCFNTFSTLYGSGEETEAILRSSADMFFTDIHRILVEYYILQVCRLTDPAMSQKKENLTFAAMDRALEDAGIITDEIKALSLELHRYRDLVVSARNKRISHLDKDAMLGEMIFGEHREEDVRRFFDALQDYMDKVGIAVGTGPNDFRFLPGTGDAIDLITVLERGIGRENP